jgi:uncharacterized protein YkwD
LRKFVAFTLALPVVGLVYATLLLRRSIAARVTLALGVGGLLGLGAIDLTAPTETTAIPPTVDVPVAAAAFQIPIEVGREPDAPVIVEFSSPMVPASVSAALEIEPPTAVTEAWDETRTTLVLRPVTAWSAATLHSITVQPGALAASGRPTSEPARALFMTRPATAVRFAATGLVAERATEGTRIALEVGASVDADELRAALVVEPALAGTIETVGRKTANPTYQFVPSEPLEPGTTYTFRLAGAVRDADGALIGSAEPLVVRAAETPEVVRFRPRDRTADVARGADLSVRFTTAMDRAATAAAWTVTAAGKPVAGKLTWAEGDTVLVFDPTADLPYGTKVEMAVAATATSIAGVALEAASTGTFTTLPEPPPPKPAPKPPSGGSSGSGGGGSVATGSWTAVESYYLGLMNCTRQGGTVTSSGGCSSPGGRNVAALSLDKGISDKVARPYAKKLATNNLCTHFSGGNPGDRLRAAGYSSYRWAENLGCRSGDAKAAVLGSHLYFQSERSYNGGHYVNMMNAAYDRVGIGVWVSSGRVRLVVDFYHP